MATNPKTFQASEVIEIDHKKDRWKHTPLANAVSNRKRGSQLVNLQVLIKAQMCITLDVIIAKY
jgi:hypothetical protein